MINFPDTFTTANINEYGIVYADQIQGHRTVQTLNDLYSLSSAQLSKSKTNKDNDAIGQEWYVVSEKKRYQLVDYSKRTTAAGWKALVTLSLDELQEKFTEVEQKIQQSIVWKEAVPTFGDISKTYTNPKEGWTVSVSDTNAIYRYDAESKTWLKLFEQTSELATETRNGLISKEMVKKLNLITSFPGFGENTVVSGTAATAARTDHTHNRLPKLQEIIFMNSKYRLYENGTNTAIVVSSNQGKDLLSIGFQDGLYGMDYRDKQLKRFSFEGHTHTFDDITGKLDWNKITNYPTSYPSPGKLRISVNGQEILYNGNSDVSVSLNSGSINAAKVNHTHTISDITDVNRNWKDIIKTTPPDTWRPTIFNTTDIPWGGPSIGDKQGFLLGSDGTPPINNNQFSGIHVRKENHLFELAGLCDTGTKNRIFVRASNPRLTNKNWDEIYHTSNKPTWDDVQNKPTHFKPETHSHDLQESGSFYSQFTGTVNKWESLFKSVKVSDSSGLFTVSSFNQQSDSELVYRKSSSLAFGGNYGTGILNVDAETTRFSIGGGNLNENKWRLKFKGTNGTTYDLDSMGIRSHKHLLSDITDIDIDWKNLIKTTPPTTWNPKINILLDWKSFYKGFLISDINSPENGVLATGISVGDAWRDVYGYIAMSDRNIWFKTSSKKVADTGWIKIYHERNKPKWEDIVGANNHKHVLDDITNINNTWKSLLAKDANTGFMTRTVELNSYLKSDFINKDDGTPQICHDTKEVWEDTDISEGSEVSHSFSYTPWIVSQYAGNTDGSVFSSTRYQAVGFQREVDKNSSRIRRDSIIFRDKDADSTSWSKEKKYTLSDFAQTSVSNTWTAYQNFKAGAGNSGSDIRFKHNIKEIPDVLDTVNNMKIIEYDWEHPTNNQHTFGISAQDLEALGGIYKSMVHERPDEDKTKWVEYERFGVLAIKAIQELTRKVDELESKIKTLENK